MEMIKNYLETLFRPLPRTEEVLRLKEELLANMEEKYRELKEQGRSENEAIGIVISEFGNIDELLAEMNLRVDSKEERHQMLDMPYIRTYLEDKIRYTRLIGFGVAAIIIGVSLMLFLSLLSEDSLLFSGISDDITSIFSLTALFCGVVLGVALFIYAGMKLERYGRIEKGEFQIRTYEQELLRNEFEEAKGKMIIPIIGGVCLCVLAPIPIFIGSAVGGNGSTYGVCVMLLIIAAAVFLFINYGGNVEGYKQLLKIEEYAPERKKGDKVIGIVASIVWPLTVVVFLIWGLAFQGWAICWIVFPIVGILFGAFAATYSMIQGK